MKFHVSVTTIKDIPKIFLSTYCNTMALCGLAYHIHWGIKSYLLLFHQLNSSLRNGPFIKFYEVIAWHKYFIKTQCNDDIFLSVGKILMALTHLPRLFHNFGVKSFCFRERLHSEAIRLLIKIR